MVRISLVGQGLLIIEASRSYTDTQTLRRIPLDESSGRRIYFYRKTHNTHKRNKPFPLAGFELTISASHRPQTHALDPHGHWDRLSVYLLNENVIPL